MKVSRLICLLSLSLLLGCVRSTITNLTPERLPRDITGYYLVDMKWEINQTELRRETIKPVVLVGTNTYPMNLTQLLTNRWEAKVPISNQSKELRYRIKVNWEFIAIPVPQANSQLSREFLLRIDD